MMRDKLPKLETFCKVFMQMEDVHDAIDSTLIGVDKRQSVGLILHGKGGYGKTWLAKTMGAAVSDTCLVIPCGSGLRTPYLYGGLDGKAWQDKGKIWYDFAESPLNAQTVIFDEGLSVSSQVLNDMRTVLQEKEIQQGKILHKFDLRFPIITTNVIPDDWVNGGLDDSEKQSRDAFLQRFVFEVKVEWKDHSASAWYNLINSVLGVKDSAYAEVCAKMFLMKNYIISPRTAIKTYDTYKEKGVKAFSRMRGVTPEIMEALKIDVKNAEKMAKSFDALTRIEKEVAYYKYVMDNPMSIETLSEVSAQLIELEAELATLPSNEDIAPIMSKVGKDLKVEKARIIPKLNIFSSRNGN